MELENRQLFINVLQSLLLDGVEGVKEPFVLIIEGKEIKASKHLNFISDIINIDLNNRKLKTAALKYLQNSCILDESLTNELELLHRQLHEKLQFLLNELDADFEINQTWSLEKYLKAFDFAVEVDDFDAPFERLLTFIQLNGQLLPGTVLCLINSKLYLSSEEITELYKFALYNKVGLLLIESTVDETKYEHERKLLIDKDFAEFVSE